MNQEVTNQEVTNQEVTNQEVTNQEIKSRNQIIKSHKSYESWQRKRMRKGELFALIPEETENNKI